MSPNQCQQVCGQTESHCFFLFFLLISQLARCFNASVWGTKQWVHRRMVFKIILSTLRDWHRHWQITHTPLAKLCKYRCTCNNAIMTFQPRRIMSLTVSTCGHENREIKCIVLLVLCCHAAGIKYWQHNVAKIVSICCLHAGWWRRRGNTMNILRERKKSIKLELEHIPASFGWVAGSPVHHTHTQDISLTLSLSSRHISSFTNLHVFAQCEETGAHRGNNRRTYTLHTESAPVDLMPQREKMKGW